MADRELPDMEAARKAGFVEVRFPCSIGDIGRKKLAVHIDDMVALADQHRGVAVISADTLKTIAEALLGLT